MRFMQMLGATLERGTEAEGTLPVCMAIFGADYVGSCTVSTISGTK
jgi:hypothetical protein